MKNTMCGLIKPTAAPSAYIYRDDLPVPEIGDNDVLIKVHCTALCGTDFHIMGWDSWSQKRVTPPMVPGHETAGDIIAVGKNVTKRKIGDRVSCETHLSCGKCYFCKNGLSHICKNTELFGVTMDGAFAEYAKVRWDVTFLLDDDISYEAACMFEPMGAGVHGVDVAEVEGKTVLISGCGPIGLTAISACKTFGATKVFACDLIDEKLEIAKEMGADAVFNSARVNLPAEIRSLTDGIGADAAIDISGAAPAINTDLKCLRPAGRMVCVGLPSKPVTLEDMADDLIFREIELTGVSGRKIWKTWEDFNKVMKGPYFKLDHIVGGRFALKDFNVALDCIQRGATGKILLYPHI